MGVNDVNFPTNVRSDEEAIQYLGLMVAAIKTQTYTQTTSATPTATAAQMVGGVIEATTQTTSTLTTDTAVAIVARMQALDANAGVGSTALFAIDNGNSGTMTVAGGTGVTLVGAGATTILTGIIRKYQIKILTLTTVSLTVVG
jgi:hypothetical protein